MPSLPDIPGKGLVTGAPRRVRVAAASAGVGVIALGGFVARRLLKHGGGPDEDPIAETPTAPPGAEVKEPKPRPPKAAAVKPKAPKAAPAKPKPPKAGAAKPKPPAEKQKPAKADKPTPAKPEAEKPKRPPAAKPATEPGNISGDKEPHHALNSPVGEPDATEYPDPFETREDPRDPVDPDGAPFGEEPHPATGSESTSEPHPGEDLEARDRAKPPQRDNLDD